MDWIEDNLGIAPAVQGKILASLLVMAVLLVIRGLVIRAVHRRAEDDDTVYRVRKLTSYTATAIALVAIGWIWLEAFDSLPTYLGLVSAGIAIALADLLKNMAGWMYILLRRPFRVGDRIEIREIRGDVIDVRLFRFTLMEVGNWVDADQSTGRLVHVPNGRLFTEAVANYTEGFELIWHEIPVVVTFESDWRLARSIIEAAMRDHAPALRPDAERRIRETARTYNIKTGAVTPAVFLTVKESGVLLTGRLLVDARQRRTVDQAVWTAVLDEFEGTPLVSLAYPTMRVKLDGAGQSWEMGPANE